MFLFFACSPELFLESFLKKYRLFNRKSDPNWRVNNCWTFALILLGCSLGPLWSHVGSIRYDDQKKKKTKVVQFPNLFWTALLCWQTLLFVKIYDYRNKCRGRTLTERRRGHRQIENVVSKYKKSRVNYSFWWGFRAKTHQKSNPFYPQKDSWLSKNLLLHF